MTRNGGSGPVSFGKQVQGFQIIRGEGFSFTARPPLYLRFAFAGLRKTLKFFRVSDTKKRINSGRDTRENLLKPESRRYTEYENLT